VLDEGWEKNDKLIIIIIIIREKKMTSKSAKELAATAAAFMNITLLCQNKIQFQNKGIFRY
jgi:hypothetical protein